jgi:hypothetical protein
MTTMFNKEYENRVHQTEQDGYGCSDFIHIHDYNIPTTVNEEHKHQVIGRTAPAVGKLDCHLHYYEGTTTCEDGHVHCFRGYTEPAVCSPGGSHRHKIEGQTSFNNQHIHYYSGFTGDAHQLPPLGCRKLN